MIDLRISYIHAAPQEITPLDDVILNGVQYLDLKAKLALAEAVCEILSAHKAQGCICSNAVVRDALEAWREATK
jgi:hypothetical protein